MTGLAHANEHLCQAATAADTATVVYIRNHMPDANDTEITNIRDAAGGQAIQPHMLLTLNEQQRQFIRNPDSQTALSIAFPRPSNAELKKYALSFAQPIQNKDEFSKLMQTFFHQYCMRMAYRYKSLTK